jgi:xanthine dehydrogenase molybdopterin-binding subunit B
MKEMKKNVELKEEIKFSDKKLRVAVKKVIEFDKVIQDSYQEQIHLCHDINQFNKLNRGTVQGELYTQHQVPSYVKALCYDTFEMSLL